MKILHTADWHLGELTGPVVDGQNVRLMDTVRCIDYLVDKANEEKPDVILIAGDLFNKSQMWASPMLNLIDIAASRLRKLAAIAPTVLMYGTANHDSMDAFKNIDLMYIPSLDIITTPAFFTVQTKSGPLQVAVVPGLDKGHFRAQYPGMDATEENAICSKLLGDLVLGLGVQVDQSIPSILMSHYTVAGCEYDNGQMTIFNNSEVILPKEALAASPFDLVCLGHIHKDQEVDHCVVPTFYSGPPNGLTFNEEGQRKGFWMHEIVDPESVPDAIRGFGKSARVRSFFIKTPAREFLTMNVDLREAVDLEMELKWQLAGIGVDGEALLMFPTTGKIVRLHYQCTEEQKKQLNHREMEQLLYKGGAFYVSEIKPVQVVAALSKQEMSENAGPQENLRSWCRAEGFTAEETLALEVLARPLIEAVSARMPTGKLSGVFIPRQLEVKNYRSYKEETFDFSPVTFATVNGPNGVGKSALFMDAMRDCLYEEPREGDLTGWISNDEAARSGSITFEFSMGDTTWRVIRTRAKSGKTTLALQELVDSEWVDRGDTKKDDTQHKIINLLGMDAMTFRCCGLIMQDAYGIFLEADRADRMDVLGNILGLGVYEQLEKLAKEKVTETNRELNRIKDKLAELGEKLKAKPGLKSELAEVKKEMAALATDIEAKEAQLREAEELVRSLEAKSVKTGELQKQIRALGNELAGLENDKSGHEERLSRAQEVLSAEEKILAKASEYEETREKVAVLQTKRPRLLELDGEQGQAASDLTKLDKEMKRLNTMIKPLEEVLANREKFSLALAKYREAVGVLEGMDALAQKHENLRSKVMEIEKVTDRMKDERYEKVLILKALMEKAAMLENSNCIDPEKANCKFLADAVASKAQIPSLEAEIAALLEQIKPLDEQVMTLDRQMDDLNYNMYEHARLKTKVAELRPQAELAAELSAKAELLEHLRKQLGQVEAQEKQLKERLESVIVWARQLAKELEPLAVMEAALPNLKKWAAAKEQLPAARQALAVASQAISKLEQDIKTKTEQHQQLNKEQDRLAVEAAGLDDAKKNADNLRGYIKHLQDKQNSLHGKAGGIKAQLDALKKDEEERRQVAAEMEPQAALLTSYQTLVRAFGQDGIPFSIVRTVVPELSAQANEILGQMTGGKMSLDMRTERIQKSSKKEVNALEIWITDYQRGSLPYKSRSGGQKVKAALSVAFALADLKARRAGIQLGMMFVDEPPFLDGEGTDAYCDALEVMSQRYQGMKVIAISHDPRMKSRFPQQIDVEDRGDEGSKLKLIA
ncbi:MAG TPA: exonuclease subunit SbcD [Desulfotomaculum sp.]|nr:MAG: hypothetical protein JL56_02800 [Desulfotomaculum sp. BICA1-6]HBX22630.1 exonuclease subunit SbcD [Desulfotomaculum sp.]